MTDYTGLHVHFMGICGSGCASIAMLASDAGFTVSGCDTSDSSYYADELKKKHIPIYIGHDASHLDNVDIVAVSPALFDISPDNPELKEAEAKGILMTWQAFMGRYLQQGKQVVAISGTHGKTTTTFLTAEIMIDAGQDPTVMGGSVYKKWGNGARSGQSDIFICEADEFNRNFYYYRPTVLVMNNVEMDHPECYADYDDMIGAYVHFMAADEQLKQVIFNADSEGCLDVLKRAACERDFSGIEFIGFTKNETLRENSLPVQAVLYRYEDTKRDASGTDFGLSLSGETSYFHMRLLGRYNMQNAVTAILIARIFGVDDMAINRTLLEFSGVGRRFDPVGHLKNIPVYDDYAHHPTEITSVLTMCKEYFPEKKVLAIFEPHQVSRLRLMFDEYVSALCISDHVIIEKTHMGREIHKGVVPISPEMWCSASEKIVYEEDPDKIRAVAERMISDGECDMIIVIGAANSYKLSRYLCAE